MKTILICIILSILNSCSLTSPSVIKIINKSSYEIIVTCEERNDIEIQIPKGKSSYFLSYPAEITIRIKEINGIYDSKHHITVNYLEAVEIIFSINSN